MTTTNERVRASDLLPRCDTPAETHASLSFWGNSRAAQAMVTARPANRPRKGKASGKVDPRVKAGLGEASTLTACWHVLADAAEAIGTGQTWPSVQPGSLAAEGFRTGEPETLPLLSPCPVCALAHQLAAIAARDIGTAARTRRLAVKVQRMAEAALRDGRPLAPLTDKGRRVLATYPNDPREAAILAATRIAEADALRADALRYVILPDRTLGETDAEPSGYAYATAEENLT